MAKAKLKDNGNVKVTMSAEQWVAINAILHNVRLGYDGGAALIADFLQDVENFNAESWSDHFIVDWSDKVHGSIDKEDGFVIEFLE